MDSAPAAVQHLLISISSNHQARGHLYQALSAIEQSHRILTLSGLYLNPAVIDQSAPVYVNAAFIMETQLNLNVIQTELKALEIGLGGQRRAGHCPLDLDIVAVRKGASKQTARPVLQARETSLYVWCCLQDVLADTPQPPAMPEFWQPMHWPEFKGWQDLAYTALYSEFFEPKNE